MNSGKANIQACNAFYYYDDLDKTWKFYRDILGFETVADYGFAKIMRVASTSYLTLVDGQSGMHDLHEPKSITLAMVSEQVEDWYGYLKNAGVPMHKEFNFKEGQPHDGFVALDPEGYFLEFERFNPHPENHALMPLLSKLESIHPKTGKRPKELGLQATVLWLYHRDLAKMQQFYESLLDVDLVVDQGWAKVYQAAGSAFIGLVDGERGLHKTSEKKCVTVSFFTDEVDAWFEKVSAVEGFELRTSQVIDESGQVRIFVGYDPEGYFLEWDTFRNTQENQTLLQQMNEK